MTRIARCSSASSAGNASPCQAGYAEVTLNQDGGNGSVFGNLPDGSASVFANDAGAFVVSKAARTARGRLHGHGQGQLAPSRVRRPCHLDSRRPCDGCCGVAWGDASLCREAGPEGKPPPSWGDAGEPPCPEPVKRS